MTPVESPLTSLIEWAPAGLIVIKGDHELNVSPPIERIAILFVPASISHASKEASPSVKVTTAGSNVIDGF